MKQKMVVTNLRMPYADYIQVKTAAAERNMSINEYVTFVMKHSTRKHMMKADRSPATVRQRRSLWRAMEKIATMKGKPMGWSKEDEAIYSV